MATILNLTFNMIGGTCNEAQESSQLSYSNDCGFANHVVGIACSITSFDEKVGHWKKRLFKTHPPYVCLDVCVYECMSLPAEIPDHTMLAELHAAMVVMAHAVMMQLTCTFQAAAAFDQ